jgi:hypothetical protein
MATRMLVHDLRLMGTAPRLAPNIYKVDGNTPLKHALGWIARYSSSQRGLDQLIIMCHGMSGPVEDTIEKVSTFDLGLGLLFCKETLTLLNVSETSVLAGLVGEIILFACGPARTRTGFQNTLIDGTRLCSELAGYTNATVVAATDTQFYTMAPPSNVIYRLFKIGPQDEIDFGAWEGKVMRFSPNGTVDGYK